MIGAFGDVIFETSDNRILNFSGFTRATSSRYATHEIIGKKPRTEFVGPSLDIITFTINLNGNNNVKIRDEMNRWIIMAREGIAETLVIGTKAIGVDKWVVKDVSEAWDTIFNQGELFSGKIDVTLEEYLTTL